MHIISPAFFVKLVIYLKIELFAWENVFYVFIYPDKPHDK